MTHPVDIEVAIKLRRRPEFADHWTEALLAKAEGAENSGCRFRGYLERARVSAGTQNPLWALWVMHVE